MEVINIAAQLSRFSDYWHPRIAGELNGQHVKLVKALGEFDWHFHAGEDELFLVVKGLLRMEYRENGVQRSAEVREGEFVVVPRGMEHRPVAAAEVHILLFEPAGTLNTGNVRTGRTVAEPERIQS